jgi:hypothetical protein
MLLKGSELLVNNIILGLVVPWLFGIYLLRKTPIVILTIVPIASLVALLINTFGFFLNLWSFKPLISSEESLSALPLDLGLYPIIACFMIQWMRKRRLHHLVILGTATLFTTLLEYAALLLERAHYDNGWNIGWTFVSYLVAYVTVYIYYRLLMKKHYLLDSQ